MRLGPIKTGLFAALADIEALVPFVFLDLGAGGTISTWRTYGGPGLKWSASVLA
jgi:hypothetical protein